MAPPRAAASWDDDCEDDLDGVEEHLGRADQREPHAQAQLNYTLVICFVSKEQRHFSQKGSEIDTLPCSGTKLVILTRTVRYF